MKKPMKEWLLELNYDGCMCNMFMTNLEKIVVHSNYRYWFCIRWALSGYLGSLLSSSGTYVWNLAFSFPCWISKVTFATGFTVILFYFLCVWHFVVFDRVKPWFPQNMYTYIFKCVRLERWVFEGNAKTWVTGSDYPFLDL